ncbi:MAG: TIM barrel protein [Kiloniellales bacterium]|nr:TIM barrel protein [Kiloniellales bacterium]
MPRFSINASFMLPEHPFLDRFAAAADLGFRAVDLQFPYDHPAEAVAARARAAGVEVVLINVPAGDLAAGEAGTAGLPGREAEFREGVEEAVAYCRALDCRRVNVLAGTTPRGLTPSDCAEVLAANLRHAAERCAAEGITVMVEALNGRDNPGFLLQTTDEALAAIARAGHGNLRLQFDLYHRQVMEGDLIRGLEENLPRIAHIQFADNPGRGAPGSGEINLSAVFDAIDRLGYGGWVGAEYVAAGPTGESLGWFRERA